MRRSAAFLAWAAALSLLVAAPAAALTVTYSLNMTGIQEVPGPGDSDGLATGTLTINDATGDISWSFTFSNILAPSDMHIHGPGGSAGSSANVFVNLGTATTGGLGTLINSTTTSATNAQAITGNPTDFYVNIHNSGFPNGAVRGQLGTVVPEPGVAALLALAGIAAFALRGRG
jgi:hypothetical protein